MSYPKKCDGPAKLLVDMLGMPEETTGFAILFRRGGSMHIRCEYFTSLDENEEGKMREAFELYKLVPADEDALTFEHREQSEDE